MSKKGKPFVLVINQVQFVSPNFAFPLFKFIFFPMASQTSCSWNILRQIVRLDLQKVSKNMAFESYRWAGDGYLGGQLFGVEVRGHLFRVKVRVQTFRVKISEPLFGVNCYIFEEEIRLLSEAKSLQ